MEIARVTEGFADTLIKKDEKNQMAIASAGLSCIRIEDVAYKSEAELYEMLEELERNSLSIGRNTIFMAGKYPEKLVQSLVKYGFALKRGKYNVYMELKL